MTINAKYSYYYKWFVAYLLQHWQALKNGFCQLSLSPLATLLTFFVIGVTLAFPVGLLVLLKNIKVVGGSLHDTAQISMYLNLNLQKSQVENLLRVLQSDKAIEKIQYISPEQGLKKFKQYSEFGNILDTLDKNPLPGVIVVSPSHSIKTSLEIQQLSSRLRKLPFVNNVQLDMVWLQRLNSILVLCHQIAVVVLLIFALGVILIIGNTLRLTLQRHKQEIFVMKLLGADRGFIRRPFLYSGIIYGLVGSIISWLLIDVVLHYLQKYIIGLADLYGSLFVVKGFNIQTTLLLLITGAILGYLGSWAIVCYHLVNPDIS